MGGDTKVPGSIPGEGTPKPRSCARFRRSGIVAQCPGAGRSAARRSRSARCGRARARSWSRSASWRSATAAWSRSASSRARAWPPRRCSRRCWRPWPTGCAASGSSTCVGLVRAAALGGAAAVTAAGGPAAAIYGAGRRRHGRAGAVPAGALGAAPGVVHVSSAADERERGSRHAGLARHARRPGSPRPSCSRRADRRPSSRRAPAASLLGGLLVGRASVRRAAARRGRGAAAVARCCRGSPPSRPIAGLR